jgi:ribosomal protein S18 acetylase RimI-like enzyme
VRGDGASSRQDGEPSLQPSPWKGEGARRRVSASSGDGYVIRPAERRDGEAVARELSAYLAHIGEALDGEGLDRDIANWEREYDGVSGVLLLVEDPAGSIVGTAALRRLDPGVGEVKRMWIRPGCQGHGLGRRLLARCLDEARSRGFRAVRLDTGKRMESAQHLYRSFGFKEIADYNGNRRAQVWMELAL